MICRPLPVVAGFARDYPIPVQSLSGVVAPIFAADDVLVGPCYQARTAAPLFTAAVAWFNGVNDDQAGYLTGDVVISISGAQSALLVPTISYTVVVNRSAAADPSKTVAIARIPLTVAPIAFG